MADIKISQLTPGAALTGAEQLPVVQGGTTVKTTTQAIVNLAAGVFATTGSNTFNGNEIINGTIRQNIQGESPEQFLIYDTINGNNLFQVDNDPRQVIMVPVEGNVGIGKTVPNATLDVNGNTIITGSLRVTSGVTGSLFGTASFAKNAVQSVTGFGVNNTDPLNPVVNNFTTSSNFTATGTNRATAAPITSVYTRVNNGGANTGVILPVLTNVGDTYYIYNTTDTVKKFYADAFQDVYLSNGSIVNTFIEGVPLLPFTIYSFTCMIGGIISMNQPQVAPYRVYTAIISQSGNNAPNADSLLSNTLSDLPVWSYVSVGIYRLTLAGAFPDGKVFFNPSFPVGYVDGAGTKGYFDINRQSDDIIQITVYDDALAALKEANFYGASRLNLEIRVYN